MGTSVASLFYVANWRFVSSGQSYFEQFVGVSPVRHTWSLSIEEQFYLVWPIVALVVLKYGRTKLLAVTAAAGVALSVLLMTWTFDSTDPSPAYYGTGTRVHQLLFGVLMAVALASGARKRIESISRD